MSDWLNPAYFTAVLIFYLINAVPSAMFGIALAQRGSRPWWHGLLPAFLLPWFGLLFLSRQPLGEKYVTGPARYSMVMLFVAGIMVFVSIWQPWVIGPGGGSDAEYSPNQAVFVAIVVWALALGLLMSSVGMVFMGGMTVALATAILVSLIGGLLASIVYLFGPAGLFLSEARVRGAALDMEVGPGGWIALVALITAYVSILVVPFGLKVREARRDGTHIAQHPQGNGPIQPDPTQWNSPAPQQWGNGSPQQQWGNQGQQWAGPPQPQGWGEQPPQQTWGQTNRPQGPGAQW